MTAPDLGVVILAGGEARRLPDKLEIEAGGAPLILRVYRNVRDAGPVYVSARGTFRSEIDAALDCPIIVDRWPLRGPLAGLYSALEYVREPRVFVTAADAPFVTADVPKNLCSLWEPGIQAIVPVNREGRLEPLCALYERVALIEAAASVLREGSGGVASAVERLRSKRVRLSDERVFSNVNTAADRHSLLEA